MPGADTLCPNPPALILRGFQGIGLPPFHSDLPIICEPQTGVTQVIIGVPKEICPGEQRVAITPANVSALLKKQGVEIIIERGAGDLAGYPDSAFEAAGAKLVDRDEVFSASQVVLQVQTPGSNTENGTEDLDKLKEGQTLIGMTDPLANPKKQRT